jgi:hypothetical protein
VGQPKALDLEEREVAYGPSRQPGRPSEADCWADGFASPPCDGFAFFETPQSESRRSSLLLCISSYSPAGKNLYRRRVVVKCVALALAQQRIAALRKCVPYPDRPMGRVRAWNESDLTSRASAGVSSLDVG